MQPRLDHMRKNSKENLYLTTSLPKCEFIRIDLTLDLSMSTLASNDQQLASLSSKSYDLGTVEGTFRSKFLVQMAEWSTAGP